MSIRYYETNECDAKDVQHIVVIKESDIQYTNYNYNCRS